MIFLEIQFTPYIPSTLIGLVGLFAAYLYFYFRNQNDNKLKEIKSIRPKDRIKAIELYLNEIGTSIDTTNLDPTDKYKLLVESLKLKARRYLIIAIVAIIFAGFITLLIWNDKGNGILDIPNGNKAVVSSESGNMAQKNTTNQQKDTSNVQESSQQQPSKHNKDNKNKTLNNKEKTPITNAPNERDNNHEITNEGLGTPPRTQYSNPGMNGKVSFNYSNNDGKYTIGYGEYEFITKWSKASNKSIHIYNDYISAIAIATGIKNISNISDPTAFDFTSRARTPVIGDIVVLKNGFGNYAYLQVIKILDDTRGDTIDQVNFNYSILRR